MGQQTAVVGSGNLAFTGHIRTQEHIRIRNHTGFLDMSQQAAVVSCSHLAIAGHISTEEDLSILRKIRIKNLIVGDAVTIYVADDAAVYEIDGYQVVCNYLALEKGAKVQRGNLPESID